MILKNLEKRLGEPEIQCAIEACSNLNTVEISWNSEKFPGKLRWLAVIQTSLNATS